MNLADLANYICTKSQLVEADDLAAAKLFLSKRYELIWNSYLWKDALVGVNVSFDPINNADNAEGILLVPEIIDRVVAMRTNDRSLRVNNLEHYYRIDYNMFTQGIAGGQNISGQTMEFAILSPVWSVLRVPAGSNYIAIQCAAADNGNQAKIIWTDQTGVQHITQGAMNASGSLQLELPSTGTPTITIEAMFKPVTTAPVTLNPEGETTALLTLGASDTRSPSYQRVRLFANPTAATTISILGKSKFKPLTFDQEEPGIRNLDNCLIAFAMADLLQRARQFGKASAQMQEGTVLLTELAKLETIQAANNSRFIPEAGYGDAYFAPSSNRGVWF